MTITLEITLAARGLRLEAFAASLLEEATHAAPAAHGIGKGAKDMVELFAPLRGLNLDFERDRDHGREIDL